MDRVQVNGMFGTP